MSAGRSTNTESSSVRELSCTLSPGCEMAATTNPASAKACAVSRWPMKLPVRPWDMTTSGSFVPSIGQSLVTDRTNGPTKVGDGAMAQGYQTAPDKGGNEPCAGTFSA